MASTGKCGTTFMTQVFGRFTDIPALHEPRPKCRGEGSEGVMENINNDSVLSNRSKQALARKVERIKECSKGGNYFEGSNYFIKAFAKTVLDNFDDVYCIYLHRNIFDLLASFAYRYKTHGFRPGFELLPWWKNNILRIDKRMNYFETIVWNWYETQARFLALKHRFVKTYDFDFKYINDMSEYCKLFDSFNIKYKLVKPTGLEKSQTVGLSLEEAGKIIRSA